MATIVERPRKGGTLTYLAQIIKRSHACQESLSFPSRKGAEAGAKNRETKIAAAIAEGRPLTFQRLAVMSLDDAIDRYRQMWLRKSEQPG